MLNRRKLISTTTLTLILLATLTFPIGSVRETTMYKRTICGAVLIAVLIIQSSCSAGSFATSFRVVVAAGAPVLKVLEQQGKITPALHAMLSTDLSNEATEISRMAGCFDSILKDDPQSKPKHLQCVQTLAGAPATKKLLSDFGANSTVSVIAADFDAIMEAAILFYSSSQMTAAGSQPSVTEAEIKARVEKLKRDLQGAP
jgi:hypothetical protein